MPTPARRPLEEASSSDDDDDEESENESEVEESPIIRSLDELPSDDSVSLASDDSEDSDSDNDDENDDEGEDDDDDAPLAAFMNLTEPTIKGFSLSEKLNRKTRDGVDSLKQRRERRAAALAKAKELLNKETTALPSAASSNEDKQQQQQQRKKSKNAPTELSSKRKDYFNRGAPQLNSAGIGVEIGAHRYKPRDPRMSSMSGRLQEDHFEYHYGFLQDLRNEEIATLQRRVKARTVPGKKGQKLRHKLGLTAANAPSLEEDKQQLQMLKQQMALYQKNQVDRAAKRSVKRKIREEVESGERGAYFIRRAEKKKLELEARYEELSKKGTLAKVLANKRKKNKSKSAALMK
jgi:ribosomal RNA-processing protein 36